MKIRGAKASVVGLAIILMGVPVGASAYDHLLDDTANSGHQGTDGTVWGTITSTAYSNKAALTLPNALCGIGFHQSPIPINLSSQILTRNPATGAGDNNPPAQPVPHQNFVEPKYPHSISSAAGETALSSTSNTYVFFNDGHFVKVEFSEGYPGALFLGQDRYPLVQFHIHAPSEHAIVTDGNGTPVSTLYDGEVHFVHQRTDGALVVLGVFLQADPAAKPNSALTAIVANTPTGASQYNTAAGVPLHPMNLIPQTNTRVVTYAGGLTTPGCNEGVTWNVLPEPLKVPQSQIDQLKTFHNQNNRILQNVNVEGGVSTKIQRTVEIHHNFHPLGH